MDLALKDKVAVVTGASGGIGLAVTKALADEGALVVTGSRTTENLDGLDGGGLRAHRTDYNFSPD